MTERNMETRETAAGAPAPYILFNVAGATYALPSRQVRHVEMVEQVTSVPNAAPFVEGVVFSRGQVVPVINLRVRFGFERGRPDLRTRLLVVEDAGRLVGLLADEAREFMPIQDAAIHPPSDAIAGLGGNYLDGVAMLGDRIVLILNLTRVLDAVPSVAS
jgi:chemotaxis signal transduction protein